MIDKKIHLIFRLIIYKSNYNQRIKNCFKSTWNADVACVVGKRPFSSKSWTTNCLLCSKMRRCPFSIPGSFKFLLALGVLGVLGDLNAARQAEDPGIAVGVRSGISGDNGIGPSSLDLAPGLSSRSNAMFYITAISYPSTSLQNSLSFSLLLNASTLKSGPKNVLPVSFTGAGDDSLD